MSLNPYAAPTEQEPEDQRNQCPVCKAHVVRLRYIFPFGYCGKCGNYLAIRNWNRRQLPWVWAMSMIVLAPTLLNLFGLRFSSRIPILLVFGLWVWLFIHTKIWGDLVPAVCWGLFAVRDDDRLPPG